MKNKLFTSNGLFKTKVFKHIFKCITACLTLAILTVSASLNSLAADTAADEEKMTIETTRQLVGGLEFPDWVKPSSAHHLTIWHGNWARFVINNYDKYYDLTISDPYSNDKWDYIFYNALSRVGSTDPHIKSANPFFLAVNDPSFSKKDAEQFKRYSFAFPGAKMHAKVHEKKGPDYPNPNDPYIYYYTTLVELEQTDTGVSHKIIVENMGEKPIDMTFMSGWSKDMSKRYLDQITISGDTIYLRKNNIVTYFRFDMGGKFTMIDSEGKDVGTNIVFTDNSTMLPPKDRVSFQFVAKDNVVLKQGETAEFKVYIGQYIEMLNLSSKYNALGDNTNLPINIKLDTNIGTGFGVKVNGKTVYTERLNGKTLEKSISVPTSNISGNIKVQAFLTDKTNSAYYEGAELICNKYNILDQAYYELTNRKDLKKYLIIDDSNRYFDNNAQNTELINKLKANSEGIFITGDNISSVLYPLLEK